ncbi:hypothetical protein ES708_12187 [subsurface metagenome]
MAVVLPKGFNPGKGFYAFLGMAESFIIRHPCQGGFLEPL